MDYVTASDICEKYGVSRAWVSANARRHGLARTRYRHESGAPSYYYRHEDIDRVFKALNTEWLRITEDIRHRYISIPEFTETYRVRYAYVRKLRKKYRLTKIRDIREKGHPVYYVRSAIKAAHLAESSQERKPARPRKIFRKSEIRFIDRNLAKRLDPAEKILFLKKYLAGCADRNWGNMDGDAITAHARAELDALEQDYSERN